MWHIVIWGFFNFLFALGYWDHLPFLNEDLLLAKKWDVECLVLHMLINVIVLGLCLDILLTPGLEICYLLYMSIFKRWIIGWGILYLLIKRWKDSDIFILGLNIRSCFLKNFSFYFSFSFAFLHLFLVPFFFLFFFSLNSILLL